MRKNASRGTLDLLQGHRRDACATGLPAGGGVVGVVEEFPDGLEEFVGALAGGGGDREDLLFGVELERNTEVGDVLGVLIFRDQIELVEGDDLWFLGEHVGVVHQFLADRRVVLGGGWCVFGVALGIVGERVEDMDDDGGAFDVSEEVVAESGTLGGAFDQTRDVRDDNAARKVEHCDTELG